MSPGERKITNGQRPIRRFPDVLSVACMPGSRVFVPMYRLHLPRVLLHRSHMAESRRTRLIHRPGFGFECSRCGDKFAGRREGKVHITRCEGVVGEPGDQDEDLQRTTDGEVRSEQSIYGDQSPGDIDNLGGDDVWGDSYGEK